MFVDSALRAMRACWPGRCEVCRGASGGALCARCRSTYAAARPRCDRCGLAMPAAVPSCGQCLRTPPAFTRAVCAVDYSFPWDRLIGQLKFEARVELAPALAALLVAAAQRREDALAPTLVVPVPLSTARLAERGFNQAWELARQVAQRTGMRAVPQALQRVLDAPAQAGLARAERLRNLRNAFAPGPHASALAGTHVALVDDVMTTGATAREAAAALLRAGAATVQLWVVARTPED